MYYNKKGEKITMEEWRHLIKDKDYKIIKQENVKDKWVSTAWLGSDYNFGKRGKPLIFETMVLPKGEREKLDMQRYATEEKALKGHEEMVKKWQNK
jgi:hypothetical protein